MEKFWIFADPCSYNLKSAGISFEVPMLIKVGNRQTDRKKNQLIVMISVFAVRI